jgi:shikimate kinase
MNIILYGYKSSGKTTIGKLLADKTYRQFVDIDRIIEDLYQQEIGKFLPMHKIYELDSEKFRLLEKQAVSSLKNSDNTVIATGGGTVLNLGNSRILKKLGKLIYLKAPKEIIKQRMLSGRLPAFLDKNDPEGSFEKMYLEREKIYTSIADVVIETDNKTNDEIIREIVYGK